MTVKSLLAVGAHPSDVEYYAGATLAAFARAGARVTLVVSTDGARDVSAGPGLAQTRRSESEFAADMLGARVVFLERRDGGLVRDERLRRDLVQEIRGARAEIVLVHDPTNFWTEHGPFAHLGETDHRVAGEATLDAIHPWAATAGFLPELGPAGHPPWWVPEVWLFDTQYPDHFVDVAPGRDAKHAALACHKSQLPRRLIEAAEEQAEAYGAREGAPSEAFRRLLLS